MKQATGFQLKAELAKTNDPESAVMHLGFAEVELKQGEELIRTLQMLVDREEQIAPLEQDLEEFTSALTTLRQRHLFALCKAYSKEIERLKFELGCIYSQCGVIY